MFFKKILEFRTDLLMPYFLLFFLFAVKEHRKLIFLDVEVVWEY